MLQGLYGNHQRLTLQQSSGRAPVGRLSRHIDVILLHDLIHCARLGQEIEVTGICRKKLDQPFSIVNGFLIFSTFVEANFVCNDQKLFHTYRLTREDRQEMEELSKDPRIGERIVKSIAPSIYGREDIKSAIAFAMFGGSGKKPQGEHLVRGDVNVLLLCDPATGKSQFLKYVEKTGKKAVYTSGNGASAVDLTGRVDKDPVTREWTLKGGALVLADEGICLIDDFDKMNDLDRVSIHEAMEQQSISISKAGIDTPLQARCSVIAAASPIGGRYDSRKTFSQNVNLADSIISLFDILCVAKDEVDPATDKDIAELVLHTHCTSQVVGGLIDDDIQAAARPMDPEILTQGLLEKYIFYSGLTIFPRFREANFINWTQVYDDLRKKFPRGRRIHIAVRHIKSMIRISKAHARMHLRRHVIVEDVDMAIRVSQNSYI